MAQDYEQESEECERGSRGSREWDGVMVVVMLLFFFNAVDAFPVDFQTRHLPFHPSHLHAILHF